MQVTKVGYCRTNCAIRLKTDKGMLAFNRLQNLQDSIMLNYSVIIKNCLKRSYVNKLPYLTFLFWMLSEFYWDKFMSTAYMME